MHEKNIRVKLHSQISEITEDSHSAPNFECYEIDAHWMMSAFEDDQTSEKLQYTTEGKLRFDDNKIDICYLEPELEGIGRSETVLSFKKGTPNSVMLSRSGAVASTLVFDSCTRRNMCIYRTEIMPIELCINTLYINNRITENGGIIKIDYLIEVNGVKAERTRLKIEVLCPCQNNTKDGDLK